MLTKHFRSELFDDSDFPTIFIIPYYDIDSVKRKYFCFVNHVVIVFWGPNEGDRKRTYIPRLFSEFMLTFRVEEPMKMCVTNQIRNIRNYNNNVSL